MDFSESKTVLWESPSRPILGEMNPDSDLKRGPALTFMDLAQSPVTVPLYQTPVAATADIEKSFHFEDLNSDPTGTFSQSQLEADYFEERSEPFKDYDHSDLPSDFKESERSESFQDYDLSNLPSDFKDSDYGIDNLNTFE